MKNFKHTQKRREYFNELPHTDHIDSTIMICHTRFTIFFVFSFLISFWFLEDIKSNSKPHVISSQTYLIFFFF